MKLKRIILALTAVAMLAGGFPNAMSEGLEAVSAENRPAEANEMMLGAEGAAAADEAAPEENGLVIETAADIEANAGVGLSDAMPQSVPVGTTLRLDDYLLIDPEYAEQGVKVKVSGAAKLDKDGVTLTATKAGKATITVTSKANKKIKTVYKLAVLANKLQKLSQKPGKQDVAAVSGGWTMWPLSVEVDKKGAVKCQFYVLNGSDEKSAKIENMALTLAAGTQDNIIAQGTFSSVKAAVSKRGSKAIKLTLQPTAKMSGVFLPDAHAAGTLYFDINTAGVKLKSKKNSYAFIATKFPEPGGETDRRVTLNLSGASLSIGETLQLTATVEPEDISASEILWSSSNPQVADVTGGLVTALSEGAASIIAKTPDGAFAECAVTVYAAAESHKWEDFGTDYMSLVNGFGSAVTVSDPNGEYSTGRLIVNAKGSLPDIAAYSPVGTVTDPMGVTIIQFASDTQAAECAAFLSGRSDIEYVEADRVLKLDQTSGANTAAATVEWDVAAVHAEKYAANLLYRGKTQQIVVAVVDTGVYSSHELFDGRLVKGYDFYYGGIADEADFKPHGTHVAGTIVSCTPNLNVKIMPVRYQGTGSTINLALLSGGICYAADKGAKVINVSQGYNQHFNCWDQAVNYAINKGCVVVCSAGNDGINAGLNCPGHVPRAITVSSVDSSNKPAWDSDFGSVVDIAAPGVNIRSAFPGSRNRYEVESGTSCAAPHVSAAAAMLLLDNPSMSPAEVEEALCKAATDLGVEGKDDSYGAGLLNLLPFLQGEDLFPYLRTSMTETAQKLGLTKAPDPPEDVGGWETTYKNDCFSVTLNNYSSMVTPTPIEIIDLEIDPQGRYNIDGFVLDMAEADVLKLMKDKAWKVEYDDTYEGVRTVTYVDKAYDITFYYKDNKVIHIGAGYRPWDA